MSLTKRKIDKGAKKKSRHLRENEFFGWEKRGNLIPHLQFFKNKGAEAKIVSDSRYEKNKTGPFFLRCGDKIRVDFSIREIRLSFWQINVKSNLPLNTTQKKLCSTFQKNILIRKKKSFPV